MIKEQKKSQAISISTDVFSFPRDYSDVFSIISFCKVSQNMLFLFLILDSLKILFLILDLEE